MHDASQIWYHVLPVFLAEFHSLPTSTNYLNISITMSTAWNVIFYDTLAEYVQQYIEAREDPFACIQILKDCGNDITKSSLHKEQVIDLPQHLCRVSFSYY